MRNAENAQVGTVNHCSVSDLNSRFRVSISGLLADLNRIVVVIIAFSVLDIIRFQIRHNPSDRGVDSAYTLQYYIIIGNVFWDFNNQNKNAF